LDAPKVDTIVTGIKGEFVPETPIGSSLARFAFGQALDMSS